MAVHKMIVRYEREGAVYWEPWFMLRDSAMEAISDVKKQWHDLNDHLFPEAIDAEFFIAVK